MTFDFLDQLPKFGVLGVGLLAFLAVVFAVLYIGNVVPDKPKSLTTGLVFLIPTLLLVGIGLVVPAIRTTILSFTDKTGEAAVGWKNYEWIFTSPDILQVVGNSALWVVFTPLLATAVGLVYAILIDRSRFESLAKTLVFLPMAISFVGASIIWKFMYTEREIGDQIGLLNQIVVWLGGSPTDFLAIPFWNNFFLIIVMVWIQAGFATVVLSAAIKGIPAEIVEAARLDGVNAWQMFWRVTVPSIRPAIIVVIVTMSIASLKLFDIVRTMTGGNDGTSVLAYEMYSQSFPSQQTGRGAALAVVLFILVVPIIMYQVRNMRQRREVK
ncbi:carbohydrate ABC transporter permease [Stackebrandtia nassauensis]|uniref:Binding-protein-dependent transport systems inner membrane component n=1 Tax=Stackebrandtia nassauensis (strain DSM 44728 / CIP 108903 / NRRL B-16338 / NBRC 102104 / LLR-40K-21) TaxID=446470 RepID=D3Q6P9_STANL|nr:sugar ABC transporter permease [Stackebrandtia nassauensis]ADD44292.1 binding-protein-dependent transport systems inner membrane component [Stackebrandtia nassauensis DSM 44728]